MSWPDHIFAGGVPGQGVPGVLQGGGDLREQLLQGVPRPRDHDPLPHLRGDVHSNHLPSPRLKVEFRTNIFPKNWIISKQISICACMCVVFWNSHLAFPWGLGGNMVWVGRARNPICGGAGPGGSQCAQPLQIWHKFWGMRVKMVTMVTRCQRGTQWWWDASHREARSTWPPPAGAPRGWSSLGGADDRSAWSLRCAGTFLHLCGKVLMIEMVKYYGKMRIGRHFSIKLRVSMLTMINMIMMNMWYKAVHWKPVNEVMLLERVQHNGYSSAEQARQSRLGKSVHGEDEFQGGNYYYNWWLWWDWRWNILIKITMYANLYYVQCVSILARK